MSIAEAAKELGVTANSLRNYIKSGEVKAYKVGSMGKMFVYEHDIQAMIQEAEF